MYNVGVHHSHVNHVGNRLISPPEHKKNSQSWIISSAQENAVSVRMPAKDDPPLWSRDNVTGKVSGFMIDILEELFKVVKLNYTISFPKAKSYSELGN